ncbi:MAG TPA: hypothetical protein VHO25_16855 [Polyangiaceae bacterium]|nr:hypothetical protein [Polyangiaceae bacterium]
MHPGFSWLSRFAIVLLFAAMLVACNPTLAPVLNVDERMSAPAAGQQSVERTHKAIRDALAARKWKVESDEPGRIVASTEAGGHRARVRITYGTDNYKIEHMDSSPGLGYDGKNIHRRYNHWVKQLSRSIDQAAR